MTEPADPAQPVQPQQIADPDAPGNTAGWGREARSVQSIADVLEHASGGIEGPPDPAFADFIRVLYRRTVIDDLPPYDPETLQYLAWSLWQFIAERQEARAKIRVFNPDPEVHGWRADVTVLEIVSDDMPFIVDSVLGQLAALGHRIEGVLHPVIHVRRDKNGHGQFIGRPAGQGAGGSEHALRPESIMHIEVERIDRAEGREALGAAIEKVYEDVRLAVTDFEPMMDRMRETVQALANDQTSVAADERAEICAFLNWLLDGHFAFLGSRDYKLDGPVETADLSVIEGSGLGLLRDPKTHVLRRRGELTAVTQELREFLRSPTAVIITKANVRSPVHRRVYMDYIGVKTFDGQGRLTGERRFVGLFTAEAYNRNVRHVPLLRRKVRLAIERAGLPPEGHDQKAFLNILETFPRDELFQVSEDELLSAALGMLRLKKRPRTKIFVRYDRFDRFVSVIVFVPRDRYDTALRLKLGELLTEAFDGRVSAFYPLFGDGPLARVHFIIGRNIGQLPDVDLQDLEQKIAAAARNWSDDLAQAIELRFAGAPDQAVFQTRYAHAFPAAYREVFSAGDAVRDIEVFENLPEAPEIAVTVHRRPDDPENGLRVKLYQWDAPIPLSDVLPLLENMNLHVRDEAPYEIDLPRGSGATAAGVDGSGRRIFVHDFYMVGQSGNPINVADIAVPFTEAFRAIWRGLAENDGFNALVLEQGLPWRDVVILRAIAKYRRQTASALSQAAMEQTFIAHGRISRLLIDMFQTRFDPARELSVDEREQQVARLWDEVSEELDRVTSLDSDRIVRQFAAVIRATLRTNFFLTDREGQPKPAVSLKIASRMLEDIPLPKPFVEVFVYAPRFEGVHLRFGKVARGGLRWSDRRDDFRTEILGLVKAQQVKNAVIVPVGAKGGFVPKALPKGPREAIQEEAVACYRRFIAALLEITDNYAGEAVVTPPGVVRHDDEDPYLVVAADKGTATFSDIANEVAAGFGFWLGDAFASGGSVGYDHKAMGITARGAWEAVKRHFREVGTDIQSAPFTCVGVGDMSGDVFGNGMLLSRHTRLVGAFNHLHIFLDPDPDPERSYKERQRLFNMPRSSWDDYDRAALSAGGGIFERTAKSIPLSPEVQGLLGINAHALAPNDLIRALLRSQVDLLWFGGIGTYIKATNESDFEVNDRANDPVRVNARSVRAKVIGEGANLGVTQAARIEFARHGGRINTDAIDNVSGVDTSDHEVNIKILLDDVCRSGALEGKGRNKLLSEMTDDVAGLVLSDNYRQTLGLTISEARAVADFDSHGRFMRYLERLGRLDRDVEGLPNEEAVREMKDAGLGLTRPEISVLLAYAKLTLFDDVLDGGVADDPYMEKSLFAYFPAALTEPYADQIRGHRLRREIIATVTANDIVDTGGPTFVHRIRENSGAFIPDVVRAYVVARDVFGVQQLRRRINELDTVVGAQSQTAMHLSVIDAFRRQVLWFLRYYGDDMPIGPLINLYCDPVAAVNRQLESLTSAFDRERLERREQIFIDAGVPEDLARDVCAMELLVSAGDIADLASRWGWPVAEAAVAYFAIGSALRLDRLRATSEDLLTPEHWDRLATKRVVEDLFRQQRRLASAAMGRFEGAAPDGAAAVEAWEARFTSAIARAMQLIDEIEASGPMTPAKLMLCANQIRDLATGRAGRVRGQTEGKER